MTDDRRESLGRWISGLLEARTLVTLLVLVVGWLGNYYTLAARVTMLETKAALYEEKYKNEVVPKAVLEKQNELLLYKLDETTTLVKVMQSQLNDYGPNSYVYRPYKGAGPGKVHKY